MFMFQISVVLIRLTNDWCYQTYLSSAALLPHHFCNSLRWQCLYAEYCGFILCVFGGGIDVMSIFKCSRWLGHIHQQWISCEDSTEDTAPSSLFQHELNQNVHSIALAQWHMSRHHRAQTYNSNYTNSFIYLFIWYHQPSFLLLLIWSKAVIIRAPQLAADPNWGPLKKQATFDIMASS